MADLDAPSRWSGALAIALACAFLAGATFGISVLDFGAHVDGPGIGLEWSRPLGDEYELRAGVVLALAVVQVALSLIAFGRARAKPIGFLALPLIAFLGMIAGLVIAGKALPAWWGWGCSRGHAYACFAASGVIDGPAGEALEERACTGDVGSACVRIARRDPTRLPAMCAARAQGCVGPAKDRPVRGRCHGLEDICRSVEPATSPAPSR